MPEPELLFRLPLGIIAVALMILMLGAMELGRRYGGKDHDRFHSPEEDAASLSGASLGLLALLLAFTYSVALSHYDLRKQLVLKEANAIGTAFLRTDFLPAPQQGEVKDLLREYTDLRVGFSASGLDELRHAEMLRETDRLQAAFWGAARRALAGRTPSMVDALLIQALNDVIDVHGERLRAHRDHVPDAVILILALVSVASVGMLGYSAGRKGDRRQWVRALLPMLIAGVIVLILDLDRPRQGFILVSQQPLIDLQASLHATPPPSAPPSAIGK